MHHAHAASTGVPLWVAVVVPLVTALLGLLGGGLVRYLLDRRQATARAEGYARVVREELRNVLQRLDPEIPGVPLLPTQAWEQHSSELAGALLPDEFSALTVVYRMIAAANWRAEALVSPIPGAPSFPVDSIPDDVRDERAHVAAAVATLGLPMIDWLALGKAPFWRRRRVQEVMVPAPAEHCRCGHRWDCHRWTWHKRGWWRLRRRRYLQRSIAHECNVRNCGCQWFREPGRAHLPRWVQRFGPGRQAPTLVPEPSPPPVDSRIPATAQPGVVVSPEMHSEMSGE